MFKYSFKVHTNMSYVLSKEWSALWENAENANIFNSYSWFKSFSQNNTQYKIFTCYEGHRLVGVFAATIEPVFGINTLVPLGREYVADTPFLLSTSSEKLLTFLIKNLRNEGRVFLTNVSNREAFLIKRKYSDFLITHISANPYINLAQGAEAKMSRSSLRDVRKISNRFGKDLDIKILEGDQMESLLPSVKLMFEIEQKSSKKRNAKDLFSKEKHRKAYLNLSTYFKENIAIGILYFRKKAIAYQFGFRCKDVFYGYQTAYLHDYRYLSPGRYLMYKFSEYLKSCGVEVFDLGGGLSDYKLSFTDTYNLYCDVYLSSGRTVMLWWKFVNTGRRLKQRFLRENNSLDYTYLFKVL